MAVAGGAAPVALVLRALGLGDLLTAVPALRGLRRALPGHRIVLATPASLAGLALLSGAVDDVVDARGLAPLRWTGPAPDVAVNLHGRGPQSHAVLAATGPRRLVAFRCGEHAGPPWDDPREPVEHEVRRWCRLLAAAGMPSHPGDLLLRRPGVASPARGAVVVHPGAKSGARRWPADRYAAVARALVAAGHPVVVTGGPGEERLARHVADGAGPGGAAVLAGSLPVERLAALVAAAALVICGDTGVAHLATAYGTASVLLFGPTPPARWGPPPGRPRHRVLWRADPSYAGDPLGDEPDPALLRIGVDDVLAAAEPLVSRSRPARRRTTRSSAAARPPS